MDKSKKVGGFQRQLDLLNHNYKKYLQGETDFAEFVKIMDVITSIMQEWARQTSLELVKEKGA